ncbi:hypothetical protein SAMD00079811_57920 [Scytonema sp. HK-05]|nr:hypothetical protein SAMD00079811_57920 [Scytonema sp. HK-05]
MTKHTSPSKFKKHLGKVPSRKDEGKAVTPSPIGDAARTGKSKVKSQKSKVNHLGEFKIHAFAHSRIEDPKGC